MGNDGRELGRVGDWSERLNSQQSNAPALELATTPNPTLTSDADPPASDSSPQPERSPRPVPNGQPAFPRCLGETPRAYSAFAAFFQLGHQRTIQGVADQLGESLGTLRNWSSKFHWNDRIQSFQSGLLQQHAEAEADAIRKEAAEWARRQKEWREQLWAGAQKLQTVSHCYLENVGDRELEKVTLPGASNALQISYRMAQLAFGGAAGPQVRALAPVQEQILDALKRNYPVQPPSPPGDPFSIAS